MKKCKNFLEIITMTWIKENNNNNELFDYEFNETKKNYFLINNPYSFYRSKTGEIETKIKDLNETSNPCQSDNFLFSVDCNLNDFFFHTNNINSISEKIENKEKVWISLKSISNKDSYNGYILSPGDSIKLGRQTLIIKEIQIDGIKLRNTNISDLLNYKKTINKTINTSFQEKNKNKKKLCRVCYADESEIQSPLINPCKCTGSLKYIHLSCLQHWIKTRTQFHMSLNENFISYSFCQCYCELCKEAYPDFMKCDSNYYQILDFSENKFNNYIKFETIPEKSYKNTKNIYIVNFDNKNTINIGRSHDSDLRITDVTVSRTHCKITKTEKNELILEDSHSKFGTLISFHMMKVQIFYNTFLTVQIGKTLIEMNIKNNNCLRILFCCKKKKNKKDKIKINDYCQVNQKEIKIDDILKIKVQFDNNSIDEEEENKILIDTGFPKEIELKKKNNITDFFDDKNDIFEDLNQLNYINDIYNQKNKFKE